MMDGVGKDGGQSEGGEVRTSRGHGKGLKQGTVGELSKMGCNGCGRSGQ